MNSEEKRALDIAITAGRLPRHTAAGRTVLATGQGEGRKRYLVLANGAKLTPVGRYWYEQTGQDPPIAHYNRNQETVRKGDGDYIKTRSGLQRVRQIEPNGSMKLTALGRKFYKDKHTEYIVEVPVIITVADAKGRDRVRTGEHLPVNEMGLGAILVSQALTDEQKLARIKSQVLRHLGGPTRAGRTVLADISGQTFSYDRDGQWLISAMGTTVDQHGRGRTEAVLHQDLGQGDPLQGYSGAAAFLPHPPECYLDEAFEQHEDCLCVPRQLAVLLHKPMEDICSAFDGLLEEDWRSQGVRPEEIERFCALYGLPYFLVRAGKLVKIVDPPQKLGRAIAYCIYDRHAYFYKTARTVNDWEVKPESPLAPMMQKECKSVLPEIREWKMLPWPVEPGYYFTNDLNWTRKRLPAGEREIAQGLLV